MAETAPTIPIRVEFTGGLELLFSSQRRHDISLPASSAHVPTVGHLVDHISNTYLSQSPRKHLFILDGAVRPGILVLINDADWELEGGMDAQLNSGDEVVFVSTLHGG